MVSRFGICNSALLSGPIPCPLRWMGNSSSQSLRDRLYLSLGCLKALRERPQKGTKRTNTCTDVFVRFVFIFVPFVFVLISRWNLTATLQTDYLVDQSTSRTSPCPALV